MLVTTGDLNNVGRLLIEVFCLLGTEGNKTANKTKGNKAAIPIQPNEYLHPK